MGIANALLHFARKIVESVSAGLMQQLNIVQDQAYKPMQMMVQQVVGGVWKGQGADAFVQEVQSLAMPNVNVISNHITVFDRNLKNAVEVIDRADQEVNNKVKALADVFGGVF